MSVFVDTSALLAMLDRPGSIAFSDLCIVRPAGPPKLQSSAFRREVAIDSGVYITFCREALAGG